MHGQATEALTQAGFDASSVIASRRRLSGGDSRLRALAGGCSGNGNDYNRPVTAGLRCYDDPEYEDAGWVCADWAGYVCLAGGAGIDTTEQVTLLVTSCPESCSDGTPHCAPPSPPPSAAVMLCAAEIAELQATVAELQETNATLQETIANQIAELQATNARLQETNATLQETIANHGTITSPPPSPPPPSPPLPSPPTFSVGSYTSVADVQSALNGGLDAVVPSGVALRIDGHNYLSIPSGRTLTNDGTVTNHGTIDNDGTVINDVSGTIVNDVSGTIDNDGTIRNSGTIRNHVSIDNNGTSPVSYPQEADLATAATSAYLFGLE